MRTIAFMALTTMTMAAPDCDTSGDPTPGDVDSVEAAEVAMNARWGDNVSVSVSGDNLIIESDGLPNHEILDVYVAENQGGSFFVEPTATSQRFEIPLVPTWSAEPSTTNLGSIGIAISGAVFFNPFEGNGATYAIEDNYTVDGVPFIDACNGHPDQTAGNYHYHGVPYCITDVYDTPGEHSVLIGYLLDGYPVYGPLDVAGSQPTDLDECSGHIGATPEFPDGTYHYHTRTVRPYSMECYHGVAASTGPGGGMPPGGGM